MALSDWGGRIRLHAENRWDVRRRERARLRASVMLDAVGADEGQLPDLQFSDRRLSECAYLMRLAELQRSPRERRAEPMHLRELAATFEDLARRVRNDRGRYMEMLAESASMWSIAGYQANAVVLAKELRRTVADETGLSARLIDLVAALIARDLRSVGRLSAAALEAVPSLGEALVLDSDDNEVDPADAALLAVYGLVGRAGQAAMGFWQSGADREARTALATLDSAVEVALNSGLVDTWLLSDNLRVVLEDSFAVSTWRQLRGRAPVWNSLWRRHLRLLAAADRPVVELWPSQRLALDAGFISAGTHTLAVHMPTSAGKSHLAEFALLAALASEPGKRLCAFVVPSRTLAAETERHLSDSLGRVGLRVSALFGGFDHSDYEASVVAQSDILVATPEKIDLLLRHEPEIAGRLALVIVDEAHLIDDESRGLNFELLIARIRRLAPAARMLMMSAVLPNPEDFGAWLDPGADGANVVDSEWTPSRLQMGVFYWSPDDEEGMRGRVDYLPQPGLDEDYFLPYVLERRRKRTRLHPDSPSATAAALALHYVRLGPVLIGSATKPNVEAVAKQLEGALRSRAQAGDPLQLVDDAALETVQRLADEVAQLIGQQHPLPRYLRQGFAYHHADVLEEVRLAIEAAYRNGHLKILCATSTLSQGVNLPTRTVIVAHTTRGQNQQMTRREFRNLAGRAGRPFNETDGHVILIAMDRRRARALRNYYLTTDIEPVRSWLYRLYLLLAQFRINGRQGGSADDVLPQITAETEFDDSGFREQIEDHPVITRLDVQLLALMAEEIIDTNDQAVIEDLLGITLCAVQLRPYHAPLKPLARYVRGRAAAIAERVPDAGVRASFYRTGLSLRGCESLLRTIDELLASSPELIVADQLDVLIHRLLGIAVRVPELINSCEEQRVSPESIPGLAADWISGFSVDELLDRHGASIGADGVMQLSICLERVVARDLPWMLSSAVEFLRLRLGDQWDPSPELTALPAKLKYGVPTAAACYSASLGIRDRSTSTRLGQQFSDEGGRGFPEFVFWLSVIPTHTLQTLVSPNLFGYVAERAAMAATSRQALQLLADGQGTLLATLVLDGPAAITLLTQSQVLELRRVLDGPEPTTIQALADGAVVGVLDRSAARCLAPLLDGGASASALLRTPLATSPSLLITVTPAEDDTTT